MTRGKIIYNLKHKGYTYVKLGKLFGVTRQCAYSLYWRHWKKIKNIDKVTCDCCGHKGDDVTWKWTNYKLCKNCCSEIIKLKQVKYSREEFEESRVKKWKGRITPLKGRD